VTILTDSVLDSCGNCGFLRNGHIYAEQMYTFLQSIATDLKWLLSIIHMMQFLLFCG